MSLPDDILIMLMTHHCTIKTLGALIRTCRRLYRLGQLNFIWKLHYDRALREGIVRKIPNPAWKKELPYPRIPRRIHPPGLPFRMRYARMLYYFYNDVLDREKGRFPKYSVVHSIRRQKMIRHLEESGLLLPLPRSPSSVSDPFQQSPVSGARRRCNRTRRLQL